MSELEVWELRYFQTSGGRVPFREWRKSLADRRAGSAVRARLERLILLLCGGEKATQAANIERAKEYRRDHEKRSRVAVGPR